MTGINPCPFCSGEAVVIEEYLSEEANASADEISYFVSCGLCASRTGNYATKKQAIEAWNNRPSLWHTGTPTEEGDYWVAFRWGLDNEIMHDMASHVLYGATAFVNGNWRIDYPYVVIAWQKIEPYKEKKK